MGGGGLKGLNKFYASERGRLIRGAAYKKGAYKRGGLIEDLR